MRATGSIIIGAALAFVLCGDAIGQTAKPEFLVQLKPVRDGGPLVTAIEVKAQVHGVAGSDAFSLTAPVNYAGNPGIADRVEGLVLRDRNGLVPLVAQDDPANPGGFPYFRHWRAQRAVSFPATISYRAKVTPDGGPPGPPFSIRQSAGGVSGSGAGFLVLPEGVKTMSVVGSDE